MSKIDDDNPKITEKVSKSLLKNWFVWIGIIGIIGMIPILIFTISLGHKFFFQIPAEKQNELEIEFNMISPLQNANLTNYYTSTKTTQALVSAKYTTDVNVIDIFTHYDEQLKQHGWQFQSTKNITDWGSDLGGKSVAYCKGEYGAKLQYAGEKAIYGWTYAFSMNWGLNECKSGK